MPLHVYLITSLTNKQSRFGQLIPVIEQEIEIMRQFFEQFAPSAIIHNYMCDDDFRNPLKKFISQNKDVDSDCFILYQGFVKSDNNMTYFENESDGEITLNELFNTFVSNYRSVSVFALTITQQNYYGDHFSKDIKDNISKLGKIKPISFLMMMHQKIDMFKKNPLVSVLLREIFKMNPISNISSSLLFQNACNKFDLRSGYKIFIESSGSPSFSFAPDHACLKWDEWSNVRKYINSFEESHPHYPLTEFDKVPFVVDHRSKMEPKAKDQKSSRSCFSDQQLHEKIKVNPIQDGAYVVCHLDDNGKVVFHLGSFHKTSFQIGSLWNIHPLYPVLKGENSRFYGVVQLDEIKQTVCYGHLTTKGESMIKGENYSAVLKNNPSGPMFRIFVSQLVPNDRSDVQTSIEIIKNKWLKDESSVAFVSTISEANLIISLNPQDSSEICFLNKLNEQMTPYFPCHDPAHLYYNILTLMYNFRNVCHLSYINHNEATDVNQCDQVFLDIGTSETSYQTHCMTLSKDVQTFTVVSKKEETITSNQSMFFRVRSEKKGLHAHLVQFDADKGTTLIYPKIKSNSLDPWISKSFTCEDWNTFSIDFSSLTVPHQNGCKMFLKLFVSDSPIDLSFLKQTGAWIHPGEPKPNCLFEYQGDLSISCATLVIPVTLLNDFPTDTLTQFIENVENNSPFITITDSAVLEAATCDSFSSNSNNDSDQKFYQKIQQCKRKFATDYIELNYSNKKYRQYTNQVQQQLPNCSSIYSFIP